MRQAIVSTNDDPGQRRIYAVQWGGLVNDTRRQLLAAVNISKWDSCLTEVRAFKKNEQVKANPHAHNRVT